jgi:hypothetical protein
MRHRTCRPGHRIDAKYQVFETEVVDVFVIFVVVVVVVALAKYRTRFVFSYPPSNL